MPTIQVTSIGRKLIENASWKVKSLEGLSVGQYLTVNVPLVDEALIKAIGKMKANLLEKEDDGYSITLTFLVDKFTHMLELKSDMSLDKMDGMAWIVPMDRTVESIILYLFNPELCDPKFLALIK
jgi:hypothetical protein